LNYWLRKVTKNRSSFPTDDAVLKVTVSGDSQRFPEMDDADKELGASVKPVRY